MGPTLKNVPAESWETVLEEKAKDMVHILQFPYNGEPPRVGFSPLVLNVQSVLHDLIFLTGTVGRK